MKRMFIILLLLIIFIQSALSQNINDFNIQETIMEFETFYINNSNEINWENVEILFSLCRDNSLDIFLLPDRYQSPSYMLFLSN